MFGKSKSAKPVSPVKQAKLDLKATKKSVKAAKASASTSSNKVVSKLALVASKTMTGLSAVGGAATYHYYLIDGLKAHATMISAGITAGLSALQAAPLLKSMSRINKASASSPAPAVDLSGIQSSINDLSAKVAGMQPSTSAPATQSDLASFKSDILNTLKSVIPQPSSPATAPAATSQPVSGQGKPKSNTHIAD